MGFGVCGGCGIPKRVATKHAWRDDGVIVSKDSDLRGIWIEGGFLHAVLDGIGEQLGMPIDHIVIDAKRRDAKPYVSNLLQGVQGAMLRVKPLRRAAYISMIGQAAALGLARARLLEYRPEERLVLRADYVYHEPLFAGDTCGAFEAIEGLRALPSYGKVGRSTFLVIEAWRDAPEDERLERDRDVTVSCRASYARCEVCGLPREVSSWRWDRNKGKVTDTATGEWIAFMNIGGFNAVFRELESELGESIPGLASTYCRRYYLDLKQRHGNRLFTDLSFLKTRGYGVPDIENPSADELAKGVVVRNAFNQPVVAGMVAAVYGDEDTPLAWEENGKGELTIKLG